MNKKKNKNSNSDNTIKSTVVGVLTLILGTGMGAIINHKIESKTKEKEISQARIDAVEKFKNDRPSVGRTLRSFQSKKED